MAKGLGKVLANLNRELAGIKNRSRAGLFEGALLVQRRSQTKVPVEYGDLKRSAYTRKSPDNEDAVETGYTAVQARKLHEDLEAKLAGKPRPSGLGVYWGPNGGPKFLERAVTETSDEFVQIVKRRSEVKK